jgi:hypothetical protein
VKFELEIDYKNRRGIYGLADLIEIRVIMDCVYKVLGRGGEEHYSKANVVKTKIIVGKFKDLKFIDGREIYSI